MARPLDARLFPRRMAGQPPLALPARDSLLASACAHVGRCSFNSRDFHPGDFVSVLVVMLPVAGEPSAGCRITIRANRAFVVATSACACSLILLLAIDRFADARVDVARGWLHGNAVANSAQCLPNVCSSSVRSTQMLTLCVCVQRCMAQMRRTSKGKSPGGSSAAVWYGPDRPKFLGPFSEDATPPYLNGVHPRDFTCSCLCTRSASSIHTCTWPTAVSCAGSMPCQQTLQLC